MVQSTPRLCPRTTLAKISTINDMDYNNINRHSQLTQTTLTNLTNIKPQTNHLNNSLTPTKQTNSQHTTMGNLSIPNNLLATLRRNPFMFF